MTLILLLFPELTLERNGFEVQTFVSSLSALENFKQGSYDLLVVDIKMRDMNGFELYDEIEKESTMTLKFVF